MIYAIIIGTFAVVCMLGIIVIQLGTIIVQLNERRVKDEQASNPEGERSGTENPGRHAAH